MEFSIPDFEATFADRILGNVTKEEMIRRVGNRAAGKIKQALRLANEKIYKPEKQKAFRNYLTKGFHFN